MKKRCSSICLTLVMVTCMLLISFTDVQAESDEIILDGSYLTQDEESIGYDAKLTRGVDLLTGYSKCVRKGPGLLYAGGTTIAAHTVDQVKIAVMIERAQKGDTQWTFYDLWTKENRNADRVGSNRMLNVEGGYHYRVRCTHSANYDMSSSFTDGIFIE